MAPFYSSGISPSRFSSWALAAGVILVVAACGGGNAGLVTLTDERRLGRFEVPEGWNVYNLSELSQLEDIPFDEPVQGLNFPAISAVGFDGSPVRDVENLAEQLPEAENPIGVMMVRQLGTVQRDFLSRAMLTQSILPYYGLTNSQELTKEDFSFGDGFDGVRALVAFEDETGISQGVAYMISVSDGADSRILSMVAGCNRECFIANQDTIVRVVDSWLVNKRA